MKFTDGPDSRPLSFRRVVIGTFYDPHNKTIKKRALIEAVLAQIEAIEDSSKIYTSINI